MIDIVRNMTRRKVRTGLTVLGIVIGVFALTVMGAMAEKMNLLVAGGLAYYGGHVTVTQGGGAGAQGLPIATSRAAQIARVPGVAAVVPSVQLPLKTTGGASMGMGDTIVGTAANEAGHEKFTLSGASGKSAMPYTEVSYGKVEGYTETNGGITDTEPDRRGDRGDQAVGAFAHGTRTPGGAGTDGLAG